MRESISQIPRLPIYAYIFPEGPDADAQDQENISCLSQSARPGYSNRGGQTICLSAALSASGVQTDIQKGEARNASARAVFISRHRRVQDRSSAQQQRRAPRLNLVVAAIMLWNTLELARAVEKVRQKNTAITPEQLVHLSPMDWEQINRTGDDV